MRPELGKADWHGVVSALTRMAWVLVLRSAQKPTTKINAIRLFFRWHQASLLSLALASCSLRPYLLPRHAHFPVLTPSFRDTHIFPYQKRPAIPALQSAPTCRGPVV